MKYLTMVALSILLIGCNKVTESKTSSYDLPAGLSDCKIYRMVGDGSSKTLYIVRCPRSETSATWSEQAGKSTVNYSTTTISD